MTNKHILGAIILIFSMFNVCPVIALETVVLTDDVKEFPLGPTLELLEDKDGSLKIDEVSSPAYAEKFLKVSTRNPNLGYTSSAYWVRFSIRNNSPPGKKWLVESWFPNIEQVDIYRPDPHGTGYTAVKTGTSRPVSSREFLHHRFVFNLPIPAQTEQTIYLRFQNQTSMVIQIKLLQADVFHRNSKNEHFKLGLYYGMLLILIIYNLFLFLSLRDRNYLLFILFSFFLIAWNLLYEGIAQLYILPDGFVVDQKITMCLLACAGIILLKFSISFLSLNSLSPVLARTLTIFQFIILILILFALLLPYKIMAKLMILGAIIAFVMILMSGFVALRKKYKPARLYFLAWGFLLAGFFLFFMARLKVLPSTRFNEYSYGFGLIWMLTMLSLALADHINALKKESEKTALELKKSEARFRASFNQTFQLVSLLTPDGEVLAVNETALKFFNISQSDVLGKPFWDGPWWTEPDQKILVKDSIKRTLAGEVVRFETFHYSYQGKKHIIDFSLKPLWDELGRVAMLIPEGRDITDRKEMETNLKESEDKYRLLYERAVAGMFAIRESDGTIINANDEAYKIFGYDPKADANAEIKTAAHFSNIEDREQLLKSLSERGYLRNYQMEMLQKDGTRFWGELSIKHYPKQDIVEGTVADITKTKVAEEVLKRSKEELNLLVEERTTQLESYQKELLLKTDELEDSNRALKKSEGQIRSLLENSPDFILNIDRNGKIIYINKGVESYTPEMIVGLTVYDYTADSYKQKLKTAIADVFEHGSADNIVLNIQLGERIDYWLEVRFSGLYQEDTIKIVMAIATDITQRILAEEELNQAQTLAIEKAHKAGMADIAAGILHNVGNLLNSVNTSVHAIGETVRNSANENLNQANIVLKQNMASIEEFLLRDPKGKALLEYYLKLGDILTREKTRVLQDLNRVKEKLEIIARVIAAQQSFVDAAALTEKYSVQSIIEDTLTMHSGALERSGVSVTKAYIDLPKIPLQKSKLVHVLVNVLDNAIDALYQVEKKEKIIRIQLEMTSRVILIKISDNGKGIRNENLKRIFMHGFRNEVNTYCFSLHSCANYMSEMNGSIRAESKGINQGATFIIQLPIESNPTG